MLGKQRNTKVSKTMEVDQRATKDEREAIGGRSEGETMEGERRANVKIMVLQCNVISHNPMEIGGAGAPKPPLLAAGAPCGPLALAAKAPCGQH